MFRSIKVLTEYTVLVKDGDIGKTLEFLFDDKTWIIRYLVVDTDNWLPRRKVLISPVAFSQPDQRLRQFPVKLTKEQVKNSPDIEVDKPISRQHQTQLNKYYAWPHYWTKNGDYPPSLFSPSISETEHELSPVQEEKGDPDLRSTEEVFDYYVQALDGEVGHVEDFIVDDVLWMIRYVVIEMEDWLSDRKILIPSSQIRKVECPEKRIYLDLFQEQVRHSSEYKPSDMVNREYEIWFYDHYGRPKCRK